jgi:hypothetical protein
MDLFDASGSPFQTLDAYIAKLVALRDATPNGGSLPVQRWSPAKAKHFAPDPVMAFEKNVLLLGGDRRMPIAQFWQFGHDHPAEKGAPVVRV